MKRTINHQLSTIISLFLIAVVSLATVSCSTTKDAGGNTTTTLTPTGDAAVTAAIQIAAAAATAAINTYIVAQPTVHARLRLAASDPAIVAAKRATEREIARVLPSLTTGTVHGIVNRAFAKAVTSDQ